MIDPKLIKERYRLRMLKKWHQLLPFLMFFMIFIISYKFNFKYGNDNNLFNDKLIDVCSIFFGVFIGCLYLFEKFKSDTTYKQFLFFSKILLYQNIVIIALSFIIILINDILPDKISLSKNIIVNGKTFIFSIYIALFSVTLYNIFKFIRIILKILKSKN